MDGRSVSPFFVLPTCGGCCRLLPFLPSVTPPSPSPAPKPGAPHRCIISARCCSSRAAAYVAASSVDTLTGTVFIISTCVCVLCLLRWNQHPRLLVHATQPTNGTHQDEQDHDGRPAPGPRRHDDPVRGPLRVERQALVVVLRGRQGRVADGRHVRDERHEVGRQDDEEDGLCGWFAGVMGVSVSMCVQT